MSDIKSYHNQSREKRDDNLIATASLLDQTGSKEKAQILTELAAAEERLSTWCLFQHICNQGLNQGPLHKIIVPASWPDPFTPSEEIKSLEDPKLVGSDPKLWKTTTVPEEINYY